jgi:hypothetical protein
MRDD